MKTPWKELFILFKEERKQLLYFSILLVIFMSARWTVSYWQPVDSWFLSSVNLELKKAKKKEQYQTNYRLSKITPININTNDTIKWIQLGFSKRQSEIIINFKNLIGGFETKVELKKVFIIDEEKYSFVEPFLLVDENFKRKKEFKTSKEKYNTQKIKKPKLNPVQFDPNVVSKKRMEEMGFSKRQINNLINYRKSGGKFYQKEDFAKLYAINETDYLLIESFLVFDSSRTETQKSNFIVTIDSLNLNSCDSYQLVKIKGIGPYYARLIMDYGKRLGGYNSVNQLYEIKKIKNENLIKFINKLYVEPNFDLIKMDLNSDNFKGFMKHPYFDYYHTKKLFDYKNKNRKFTSLQDLKKMGFIDPDYVDKITPYLKIEQ